MESANIKIYDEEYKMVHETYLPKAEELGGLMEKYFETLSSIIEDKILEGDTALALQNFAALAKLIVSSHLGDIAEKHKMATVNFIEEVELQDDTKF